MCSATRMYKACFVTALGCLLAVVESKPAPINWAASTSVSRCLSNPSRITEQPIASPIELTKNKRQETDFDICAYTKNEPFTCAGSGTCTSLSSESIDYVGCCSGEGECYIYSGCYDGEATVGTGASNPRILSCVGPNHFCATVLWPQESKAAYICAEQPRTITVDGTADSPTPSSTNDATATETHFDISNPESGPIEDLTKGQKIGIGAGCGGVSLLFAAGIGYCCCCSNNRRQRNASKKISGTGTVAVSEVSEIKPNTAESH